MTRPAGRAGSRREAAFVLVLAATGVSCGGTSPSLGASSLGPSQVSSASPSPTPEAGPSQVLDSGPQRTVSGLVQNTALEPVPGAQVSIVSAGLSTMTDAEGRFNLRGNIDVPAMVQVAKDGYVTQTREPTWGACPPGTVPCFQASMGFLLNAVAPATDVVGEYSVTILADANCAELPADARARTYGASITSVSPDNTSLDVRIDGGTLYVWGEKVYYAGMAGDRFALRLEGTWFHQAFMEELAANTYVGFAGFAAGPVTHAPSTAISTVLDGTITYCRTSVPLNEPIYGCRSAGQPPPVSFMSCSSKNHRMVFTRR